MTTNIFIRALLVLGLASAAWADSKLAWDLPSSGSTGNVDVIIQFASVPTNNKVNSLGQWGHLNKIFDGIKAIELVIPAWLIPFLESDPLIAYISPNRPTASFLDVSTSSVGATFAWQNGWDGSGVGVAVIDSGIAPVKDLTTSSGATSRVVYSQNFVSGETTTADLLGHGTHVAGIIGSNGQDSTGPNFTRLFKGLAPNSNLINLRVLDRNGSGRESDLIDAIMRAIALKNQYNIRVINLSLGRPVFESYKLDPLCQAVESAWKAGIVVVVAAGNSGRDTTLGTKGYGTISSPGNDPYVITVGAMNSHGTTSTSDDTIASYSSKGPTLIDHIVKPDLVAPGNKVVSLMAPGNKLAANNPSTLVSGSYYEKNGNSVVKSSDYLQLSGTSMATPVVSGAAALLLQRPPRLTPDQVKARLMKTAFKTITLHSTALDALTNQSFTSQADIFTVGAGYVNIPAALGSNDMATLPARSPSVSYRQGTHQVVLNRGAGTWGDTVLWGDASVWGNFVFKSTSLFSLDLEDSVLWGDTVLWGDSTLAGFTTLWGDTVNPNLILQSLASGSGDQF